VLVIITEVVSYEYEQNVAAVKTPFNTEVKERVELYLYSPLGLDGLL
jgi:hypothetical protein